MGSELLLGQKVIPLPRRGRPGGWFSFIAPDAAVSAERQVCFGKARQADNSTVHGGNTAISSEIWGRCDCRQPEHSQLLLKERISVNEENAVLGST